MVRAGSLVGGVGRKELVGQSQRISGKSGSELEGCVGRCWVTVLTRGGGGS